MLDNWLGWRFGGIEFGWAGLGLIRFGDFVGSETWSDCRIGWIWLDIWLCQSVSLVGDLAGWTFGGILHLVGL